MDKKKPILVSAISGVFLVLFILSLETIFIEMGLTAAIERGWGVIEDAGYADWVRWGALFFTGAAAARWADWFVSWYRTSKHPFSGEFRIVFSDKDTNNPKIDEMRNIHRYLWSISQRELWIFVAFETPIENPVISVAADRQGLKWVEQVSSAEYALIKIAGDIVGAKLGLHFVSQSHTEARRQHEFIENEVNYIEDYENLIEFQKQVSIFYSVPKWQRLFKKFKYRKSANE